MGMGLGHQYWVELIKYFSGTLEECIDFMKNNKPRSNKEWYELRPIVHAKEGTCTEYMCNLVRKDKERGKGK